MYVCDTHHCVQFGVLPDLKHKYCGRRTVYRMKEVNYGFS